MNLNVVEQVSQALSVATLRNQVIASNIANRDAQGYQRLQLRFEEVLGAAEQVAKPVVTADPSPTGASLEEDMVALSSNTLHYQALARALSRYFSIAQTIANGGRS